MTTYWYGYELTIGMAMNTIMLGSMESTVKQMRRAESR